MRNAVPSRSTLRAVAILSAGLLAACGSSRKLDEGIPLCQRCHGGGSGNAAPPTSVGGATATTTIAVGAHQAHVVARRLRGPIGCGECHVVPADMPEHQAGIAAIAAGTASRVTFGVLADRGAGTPAWDPAAATCTSTYCHGANLDHGGSLQVPTWTVVDAGHSQAACGTCHGYPPDPTTTPHPDVSGVSEGCSACHAPTVAEDDLTIRIGPDGTSTHVDGNLTLDAIGATCDYCHGLPPTTGAHPIHTAGGLIGYGDLRQTNDVLPYTATVYDFGCGQCHPLDFAEHARHFTESVGAIVALTPDAGTAGSLRGLNSPLASYDPVDGTCSGVYCHSSGQSTPSYGPSPAWWDPPAGGCGGCHGNPPSYLNGGAGASNANSHVGLLRFGDEFFATGHFAGLPAALHQGSAHGGGTGTQFDVDSAAPITCQTCHFYSVAGSYSASGFYYWNPDGLFDVRTTPGVPSGASAVDCTACHVAAPPAGLRIAPYFHVNGDRNVDFDSRATLGGTPALPPAPDAPTRPYWYTRATTNKDGLPYSLVPDAVARSSVPGVALAGSTLELELSAARWNATDKSCSSVACHLNHLAPGSQPLRWGQFGLPSGFLDPEGTCSVCHDN